MRNLTLVPSFLLLAATCLLGTHRSFAEDILDPLGRAWSKKTDHYDGTRTFSKKDSDANTITEETYDQGKVMVVRRMFWLDTDGNLRRGLIFDGKNTPKASTIYNYRGKTMVEERMFDAKGRPIRRLFPPGVLPDVPQNQRSSISVTIDPETGKETTAATSEKPVTPVDQAQSTFDPGLPKGTGLQNDRLKVPDVNPSAPPSGRKPMLPQKK